jgi:hypothetical protein
VKGFCHAHLYTPGVSTAQVAFSSHSLYAVKLNTAEGTGRHTQSAADTAVFINHDGMGPGIPTEGSGRTYFHAHGHFTLTACGRKNAPMIHVHMNKDIGCMTLVDFGLMK